VAARTTVNLQDSFLNQVRKDNILTTVYLINGFQLRGTVKGFDNFTVVMDSDGKQMLIYKHAISTITPAKPVNLYEGKEVEKEKSTDEKKTVEISP